MGKRIDLSGQIFGRLTVLRYAETIKTRAYWGCVCECGNFKTVRGTCLKSGNVQSCGCLHVDKAKDGSKHGMQGTPVYKAWCAMKGRCNNPNDRSYKNYGGRGINVCVSWEDSFENFYKDMGDRPDDKHSLDRIDNEGNYCPENCRWVDRITQNRNKRLQENCTSQYRGVHWDKIRNKWVARIMSNYKATYLGGYDNEDDAARAFDEAARKEGYIEDWLNFPK